MNCCGNPFATEGVFGVTAIDTKVAGNTVMDVFPLTGPNVAAIVILLPAATAVASPWLPAVLLMATFEDDDDQVTCVVRSRLLPLVYVPKAANCWVVPFLMEGLSGVTAMDASAGGNALNVAICMTQGQTPEAVAVAL